VQASSKDAFMPFENPAPGWPGISARWTSSAKDGVGTAASGNSRVWFTLSHGILNEIYYPRVDLACTRDFGFLVTDGKGFFSEEKRDTNSTIHSIEDGVPAFVVTSTCNRGRYRLQKLVLAHPEQDVLLQYISFHALQGTPADYRLYALVAPHLVNRGAENTAWVADYKGSPMLFAKGRGTALAVGCSTPFTARSVGFVGFSDGWQDLSRHFEMQWRYNLAENGNVALTGEIDLKQVRGAFTVALGLGHEPEEAALRVRTCLEERIAYPVRNYVAGWRAWQKALLPLASFSTNKRAYSVGTATLKSHGEASFPGGYIASLSVPWGFSKGDEDLGGYHLIWPRDLVEIAGGLLAAGAKHEARQAALYLRAIQEPDGHWPQNCWLDGTAYWTGVQMDECALPILLVDLLRREGAISDAEWLDFWPMVKRAASFIAQNGPVTGQDRWEEDGGYSTFTLAAEVSGLLAAADLADRLNATVEAAYLRQTADIWNSQIENWTYACGTDLARQAGVEGYYVRIAPPETADAASPVDGFVPIKNRPPGDTQRTASQIVSPDALALVRFGLRAPDDPRIRNTIRILDTLLKVELPAGPCWRRYNEDGYGEHEDGSPFDGTGVGRPWPLLTGERAHYELAAGNRAEAERLLAALEGFANGSGLIPEQVWDAPDIAERELYRGKASGSAMPLAWAHAEHIKLLRSLADGRVFDTSPQPMVRCRNPGPPMAFWRCNHKCRSMGAGQTLRIELRTPASIRWSIDNWTNAQDTPTTDSGLGMHYADIDVARVPVGGRVLFTFHWTIDGRWEETDYIVAVQ
jgi:glucoamylase